MKLVRAFHVGDGSAGGENGKAALPSLGSKVEGRTGSNSILCIGRIGVRDEKLVSVACFFRRRCLKNKKRPVIISSTNATLAIATPTMMLITFVGQKSLQFD